MKLSVIRLKLCFVEKEGCLSQENIPGGMLMRRSTCVSLHKHPCLPSQANMSKQLPEKPVKLSKKLRNSLLNPNTEPSHFQTTSTCQVLCCF